MAGSSLLTVSAAQIAVCASSTPSAFGGNCLRARCDQATFLGHNLSCENPRTHLTSASRIATYIGTCSRRAGATARSAPLCQPYDSGAACFLPRLAMDGWRGSGWTTSLRLHKAPALVDLQQIVRNPAPLRDLLLQRTFAAARLQQGLANCSLQHRGPKWRSRLA